jgi:DNA-binding IclR family transcriptional regulator
MDILEMLASQPEGLTKSQLARELNRSVSEIFRMLLSLERRGYIAQQAEDRYSLTLKLFQLAQEHPPTERLIVDAYPVMQRLTRETLQSCHLGVLQGRTIVILAQNNAPVDVGFYVKLGSTVDLMEAASGYVILAHQDDAHRQRTLAEWSRLSGGKPPADLGVHLRRIRKAGFEKRPSYLVKGVVNISFPVLNHQGSAVAALTTPFIQYIHKTPSAEETIACLRKAAAEITAAIGGGRFVSY